MKSTRMAKTVDLMKRQKVIRGMKIVCENTQFGMKLETLKYLKDDPDSSQ